MPRHEDTCSYADVIGQKECHLQLSIDGAFCVIYLELLKGGRPLFLSGAVASDCAAIPGVAGRVRSFRDGADASYRIAHQRMLQVSGCPGVAAAEDAVA